MNNHPDGDEALREAELADVDAAVEELSQQGFTPRRCLRCSGRLGREDKGCASMVHCETENRLRLTFREI